jgi:hypothetical protein
LRGAEDAENAAKVSDAAELAGVKRVGDAAQAEVVEDAIDVADAAEAVDSPALEEPDLQASGFTATGGHDEDRPKLLISLEKFSCFEDPKVPSFAFNMSP